MKYSGITKVVVIAVVMGLLLIAFLGCSGSESDGSSSEVASETVPGSVLKISSTEFTEKRPRKRIPKDSTCYGKNVSPSLDWSGVPVAAKSLAIIVEEPEERLSSVSKQNYSFVPSGGNVHWVLFNIPPEATGLPKGVPTSTEVLPDGTVQGMNNFGEIGYSGPCPSASVVVYWTSNKQSSDKPREYFFRLYALDVKLDLAPGATKIDLAKAMEGHILFSAETSGKYQGPRQQGWYSDSKGTPLVNTPTPVP